MVYRSHKVIAIKRFIFITTGIGTRLRDYDYVHVNTKVLFISSKNIYKLKLIGSIIVINIYMDIYFRT